MLRSELITVMAARHTNLAHSEVEEMVDIIFDEIARALERGDRVELRGFGAFSVRERDARQGRNPRTGQAVKVEPKRAPFFRCGKELRQKLNPDGDEADD